MNTAWSKTTKYLVAVGLVLLGIYVLALSRPIIPLLVMAALIAVIVRPIILWLYVQAHVPRTVAVAIVYLLLAILMPLGMLLIIPPIIDAVSYVIGLDYQSIFQGAMDGLRSFLISLKTVQLPTFALDSYVDQTIDSLLIDLAQAEPTTVTTPSLTTLLQSLGSVVTTSFDFATGLVGAVFSQVATLVFVFLASIYISLGAHTYRGGFLRAIPVAYRPEIAILMARIERLWNAFFRGELTLMVMIGMISWVGLTILGVPGAVYLGIIAGLLELIPNLGPIIATVPAVIVALLQGSTYLPVSPLVLAGLVIGFYVLLQQVENNVVVPRVLGDAVELPPLVVMSGVLVGATTAGILGALLATPVVGTVREILRYVYRKMLGEDPFLIGELDRKDEGSPVVEPVRPQGELSPGLNERIPVTMPGERIDLQDRLARLQRRWNRLLQQVAPARSPAASPPTSDLPPEPERDGPREDPRPNP